MGTATGGEKAHCKYNLLINSIMLMIPLGSPYLQQFTDFFWNSKTFKQRFMDIDKKYIPLNNFVANEHFLVMHIKAEKKISTVSCVNTAEGNKSFFPGYRLRLRQRAR